VCAQKVKQILWSYMFSHFWTTGRPQVFLPGQPISSVVAPRSFFLHLCNDTYLALAYADDANLIGVDIKTIEVNTDVVHFVFSTYL